METDQFYSFFLPELQELGYDGVFSPKSRAKTMSEQDRRYVDGCAIFYRTSKWEWERMTRWMSHMSSLKVSFDQTLSGRIQPIGHVSGEWIGLPRYDESRDDER